MTRILPFLVAATLATPALAQEQQAGTATDTEAAFQALIDACDDVDALMLRARIRLQLPRTTEEAAAKAQEMLQQGFQTCADGDPDAGKAILTEALSLAEAGATENFGTDGSGAEDAEASDAAADVETASETDPAEEAEDKPWWRFW